jgi:hypothetical protein
MGVTATSKPREKNPDSMWWRFAGGVVAAWAVVVFAVNVSAAGNFSLDNAEDLWHFGLPMLCLGAAIGVSVVVLAFPNQRRLSGAVLRGAMIGAGAFLAFMSYVFERHYDAIAHSGMMYWASVYGASILLGLPLLVFGALVGAKFGGAKIPTAVLHRRRRDVLAPPRRGCSKTAGRGFAGGLHLHLCLSPT